jgi:hypothetical protein
MSVLGVDVARGGRDRTVLSPRHGHWFGVQVIEPGSNTPDGPAVAALVVAHRKDNAAVCIDVIGVGTSPYDCLRASIGVKAVAMNGASGSEEHDKSGQLGFVNSRAEWYWRLREALDPSSGQDLALPPDPELRADLCAPTWGLTARGIQIESKDDISKRIHRSPDKGDALVYASYSPPVLAYEYTSAVATAKTSPAAHPRDREFEDEPRARTYGGGRATWRGL